MLSTQTPPADKSVNLPTTLRVYSTLTKTKQPLETVRPGHVGMYLCGPTVYKPSHIGHMVGPVIFDCVKRYLAWCGYQVTFVVNITDVDDKLINESNARGMTMAALAQEMTEDYFRNLAAMGVDTIDHFPKATDHIEEIIAFTQGLIDKGFAYPSDGDVYFDVGQDREYGKLSHRSVEQLQGEGGTTAERKRSAADFALWKKAKPGEPSWDSPWGPGRPGWHIECSVMSKKLLGETFDIHGGGLDLVFPHHENEVAQSECLHGKPQARYWMHNGLMQASSEVGKVGGRTTRAAEDDQAAQNVNKISKSTGARPFSELLERFAGETIRFFLINNHYRRPIDFSLERIEEVERGLETFYRFFDRYHRVTGDDFYQLDYPARRGDLSADGLDPVAGQVLELRTRFIEAMDDDFNTGGAIGDLFELLRLLNRFVDAEKLEAAGKSDAAKVNALRFGARVLRELSATLGLFRAPVAKQLPGDSELVAKLMQLFIDVRAEVRSQAKATKNKDLFALADKLRDGLTEIGIALEDRADGTSWTLTKKE